VAYGGSREVTELGDRAVAAGKRAAAAGRQQRGLSALLGQVVECISSLTALTQVMDPGGGDAGVVRPRTSTPGVGVRSEETPAALERLLNRLVSATVSIQEAAREPPPRAETVSSDASDEESEELSDEDEAAAPQPVARAEAAHPKAFEGAPKSSNIAISTFKAPKAKVTARKQPRSASASPTPAEEPVGAMGSTPFHSLVGDSARLNKDKGISLPALEKPQKPPSSRRAPVSGHAKGAEAVSAALETLAGGSAAGSAASLEDVTRLQLALRSDLRGNNVRVATHVDDRSLDPAGRSDSGSDSDGWAADEVGSRKISAAAHAKTHMRDQRIKSRHPAAMQMKVAATSGGVWLAGDEEHRKKAGPVIKPKR
jgi:hypothetical protein